MKVRINLVIVLPGQLVPAAVDSWSLKIMAFIVLTLHWVCFLSETQEMRPVTRFIDSYQRRACRGSVWKCPLWQIHTITFLKHYCCCRCCCFFTALSLFTSQCIVGNSCWGFDTHTSFCPEDIHNTCNIFTLFFFFFFWSYLYICSRTYNSSCNQFMHFKLIHYIWGQLMDGSKWSSCKTRHLLNEICTMHLLYTGKLKWLICGLNARIYSLCVYA